MKTSSLDDICEEEREDENVQDQPTSSAGAQWLGLQSASTASKALMKSLAGELGYSFYLLANIPVDRHGAFQDITILTNWPPNARASYSESEIFCESEAVSHFRQSILPLNGGSQMFGHACDPVSRARAARLLGNFGIQATFAFTLHTADGQQYMFACSRRGPEPEMNERGDTLSRSMKILDTLKDAKNPMKQPSIQLSQRERECLEWCAAGKTAEETAIITKLSVHTVESYVRSAMRKLGAVNRMHAVARAIRLKAI
ncbi:MAG: LuxR C-terminal-related transcriptional regulator [Rhizobium sp.]|nr:LuxR C-terminal-related transcriptional regulator [Rhizobium sp.]